MDDNSNITSQDYWEERWDNTKNSGLIEESDPYWGRDGIFMKVMRRHCGSLRGLQVIELGGAGSQFLLAMAKWEGADVTAVDYSESGLERLRELFSVNGCSVNAICEDIFSWEPGTAKYDLVVHWGLLEHFQEPASVMQLCRKLITSDGRVVFTMPNLEAWGSAFWRLWCPKNWETHIFHSDQVVEKACKVSELKLEKRFYSEVSLGVQGYASQSSYC